MRVLVTGAAGFIGSTLSERLIGDGHTVVGIDNFSDYYDRTKKERNLTSLRSAANFTLLESNLLTADLSAVLEGIDVVFHQAGQPGVRLSWASGFDRYVDYNVKATQKLLEAARGSELKRFVYASSSSVYGDAHRYPVLESDLPRPRSPYGVTKLAAEQLASLYAANYGVPTTSLRYFTVYGPRQRPDMATHRLIESALTGSKFRLFGDGSHVRDFTYVSDIVEANVLAATAETAPGEVFNLSGGSSATMNELIQVVTTMAGRAPNLVRDAEQPGDVVRTGGDSSRARSELGWAPQIDLEQGVAQHVTMLRDELNA